MALSAILMPFAASCDYLDKEPDDMLTLDGVFNNADYTEEWLANIYSLVPDPLWGYYSWNGYGYYMRTDECQMHTSLGQFGWGGLQNIQNGSWVPTKQVGINLWSETYKKVRSALIFIENVKPLPDQRQTVELVERYKNEARFLMAYYYSMMLELYGPFPLVTSLSDVSASTEDLQLPRTPYDDIVNYLDNEFMELSRVLPDSYDDTNVGRPTKGACLALRARMLMFAASPLFNGNPDFKDVKNPDGTYLFSQSEDPSKWRRAADAVKLVIDMPQYDLYKEYLDNGEIDALMSCINLHLKTSPADNKEIIFSYQGTTSWEFGYHLLPRGSGWAGCISATQNMVDAFFMKNGLPIDDPESDYVEEGFSTEDVYYDTKYTYGSSSKTPGLVTPRGTYNMYVNREPRFYASIRYHGQYCSFDETGRTHNFLDGGIDGRPSHDSPIAGYQINKAIHPASRAGQAYPYRAGIILRLGEMYLDYAEALNECDPQSPDIKKYLNLVRERAGIPPIEGDLTPDEMREAIRRERTVEFAYEAGMRYNDMRRWKIAEEVFETPIVGMNIYAKSNADYFKRTEIQKRVFLKKMYLWPILQDYLDNNPNLVQNKYW